MKTIDITGNIMEQIICLEKKRTSRWLKLFFSVVIVLCISVVFLTVRSIRIAAERQLGDLLLLFREDPEIIMEYWKDTLWIIWMELPQKTIGIGLACFAVLCIVFVSTRRRRKIIQKKREQLDKRRSL